MSRGKLQKYFKLNEDESIESKCWGSQEASAERRPPPGTGRWQGSDGREMETAASRREAESNSKKTLSID